MADGQGERDAAVRAAFEAYEKGRTVSDEKGRARPKPYAEQRALWEAMWAAADFSWEGLADGGWERRDKANEAQKLKRWQAPASFPLDAPAQGEGDAAFKPATLQDYWRWVPNQGWTEDQGWAGGRLANDEELKALGLLVEVDGQLWHALHRAELRASVALDSPVDAADLRREAANSAPQMGPEPKATIAALATALAARLALATTSAFDDLGRPKGADGRLQLAGARAQGLDARWRAFAGSDEEKRPLHLAASLAAFGTLDAKDLTFGDGADFRSGSFGAGASFRAAQFARGTRFRSTSFGDEADIGYATFGDGVDFNLASFGDGASFRSAAFGQQADFSSATFGDEVLFGSASFGDGARFRSASFGDHADIGYATFGDRAFLRSAKFGDGATFGCASFGGGADFRAVMFGSEASFSSATFGDEAHFDSSAFGREASFSSATLGHRADFEFTTFGDGSIFRYARFGDDTVFRSATFGGGADFSCATFGDEALFGSASFGDGALFGSCNFGDGAFFRAATFGDRSDFSSATFGDRAVFGSATFGVGTLFPFTCFGDGAFFRSAQFKDRADFRSASFGDRADFDSARFQDAAVFNSATFAGKLSARKLTCAGRFRMRAAEVRGYADFSGAIWPEKLEDQHAAFEGCRFRDVADFKTKDFTAFALFDGAEFKGRVLLAEPVQGETSPDALFARAMNAARDAVAADAGLAKAKREHAAALARWQATEVAKPETRGSPKPEAPEDDAPDERGADARFGALSGGLRTLKLAMAEQSDIDREQRFYRFELKARAKRPSEPLTAKWAASLYGWASDYGAAVGRPVWRIIELTILCAVLYWLIGGAAGLADLVAAPLDPAAWLALREGLAEGLSVSASRIFPLGAFDEVSREWFDALEQGGVTGIALVGVRFLASLQSLCALILAFMTALALRRRFQIDA